MRVVRGFSASTNLTKLVKEPVHNGWYKWKTQTDKQDLSTIKTVFVFGIG